jgi:phage terminase large subunit-like protein
MMPDKKRAKDKIDPAVAMIMAISEILFAEQAPIGSYYETHDVESA